MYVYNHINTLLIDVLIFRYIHNTMKFYISTHSSYECANYTKNEQVKNKIVASKFRNISMLDRFEQINYLI